MIEMHLMPSKETDRKLRWATYVEEDETEFKLYIPKWRVPRPWPAVIRVSVREASGPLPPARPLRDLRAPIRVRVKRVAEMVHSVRFAPHGNPETWEIGEPYIPYSLLPSEDAAEVDITVEWDFASKDSRGWGGHGGDLEDADGGPKERPAVEWLGVAGQGVRRGALEDGIEITGNEAVA